MKYHLTVLLFLFVSLGCYGKNNSSKYSRLYFNDKEMVDVWSYKEELPKNAQGYLLDNNQLIKTSFGPIACNEYLSEMYFYKIDKKIFLGREQKKLVFLYIDDEDDIKNIDFSKYDTSLGISISITCKINEEYHKKFNNLPIKCLDISNSEYVSYQLFKILAGQHLVSLSISGVNIDDNYVSLLKSKTIQSLCLARCPNITNKALKYLHGKQIVFFDISGCHKITDEGIYNIRDMKLIYLNLTSDNHISDKSMSYINKMPLKYLFLPERITDTGMRHISQLKLCRLTFMRSDITNKGLEYLKNMPIQYLSFYDCKNINDTALLILKDLPLKTLSIKNCTRVSEKYQRVYINEEIIKLFQSVVVPPEK